MISDAISSVGIVFAAVVIFFTGLNIIDPLISLGIAGIIVYWSLGILQDSSRVLLEMAPKGLNVDMISNDLKHNFSEIEELYNVHLWTIVPDMLVFSAHIKLDMDKMKVGKERFIRKINQYLLRNYDIVESTLQIIPQE
jgi:cobalt-zinc-cadmium efflux system protein